MLLAGDTNSPHMAASRGSKRLLCGRTKCIDPPLWLLLTRARLPLNQSVWGIAAAKSRSLFINQESLGSLRTAINAQIHSSCSLLAGEGELVYFLYEK
jgi:hypothetical protein